MTFSSVLRLCVPQEVLQEEPEQDDNGQLLEIINSPSASFSMVGIIF